MKKKKIKEVNKRMYEWMSERSEWVHEPCLLFNLIQLTRGSLFNWIKVNTKNTRLSFCSSGKEPKWEGNSLGNKPCGEGKKN